MTENAFLQEKKDRQFRRAPSVSASISPWKRSTTAQVRTCYRNSGCLVFQLPPSWAGPTRISSAFAIGLYLRPRPRPSIGVIV